jgi:hypothetical protein
MTLLLQQTLDSIGVVSTIDDTFNAMEAVRNLWWSRDKGLPSRKILIERQLNVYAPQLPWLVPEWSKSESGPHELQVPNSTCDGRSLNHFYQLDFRLNGKFNTKEIFSAKKKNITQNDFETLLSCIEKELNDSMSFYR